MTPKPDCKKCFTDTIQSLNMKHFFPKLIPLIYVKVNVENRLSALKILVCSQEYYGAKKTLDVN